MDQLNALLARIKAAFEKAKDWIIGALGLTLVVVLWILNIKSNKEDALKTQIAMADTNAKANALEAQIKSEMAQAGSDEAQIANYQSMLDALAKKRADNVANLTPGQVEDYWKNNQ